MIYNVARAVIANVEAESPEKAQRKLERALTRAGFTVYYEATDLEPFEAEDGTVPGGLPA